MKVYSPDRIRNVVLVGHQGSGKTSLAESMLYVSKKIRRLGTITEGSTVSDYQPSEKERQMSIFSTLLHAEWKDHKINIMDTPGYPDFVGEVVAAVRVADTSIFVMNAQEGIEVGTELAWNAATENHKPVMFVINQIDRPQADVDSLITQMRDRFGSGITIVQFPGGDPNSLIDVLVMKQITFKAGSQDPPTFSEIPDEFRERAEELHNALVEDIAVSDEELMEKYLETERLTEDEMRAGLRDAMLSRSLYPVFCTVATTNVGTARLMSFIDNVAPSPVDVAPLPVSQGKSSELDVSANPVVFVYRTMAEHHVGDYSFFRVCNGTIESGMDLENPQSGTVERLGQLYVLCGRDRETVPSMSAGDLGALVKLRDTHTNNTLRKKGDNIIIEPIPFPEPRYREAIRAKTEGEEDKLAQGLHQITSEDPSLVVVHEPHLSQISLGGQGAMHLKVAQYRLKSKVNVEVEYARPRVAYRETVTTEARDSYRHKKQTGGAGQFADISVLIEPLDGEFQKRPDINVRNVAQAKTAWGSTIEFIDAIVGGVIDMRRFFGAIQKGVLEGMQRGPVAGYPVGDVRFVIYDGGMHSVDSNENAFRTAARMVFRESFRKAKPVILEPIHDVEVTVPDTYTGDVMGDLNGRRATIKGMEAEGIMQKILVQVPEAELYQYSTRVRSMTQGRGIHSARFSHYQAMPRNVQEEVVATAAKADQE
ncbi:MAG: elongation factor G [Bacteroidetes bacterium]|nr:elongation factor G [Bacteroidota bacterium]